MNNAVGIPLNCGTFVGSGVPIYTFKKPAIGGDIFTLNATPITRTVSSATSGIISSQDLVSIYTSGSSTITDYLLNINYNSPDYDVVPTIYSSNSGVLTISNNYGSGIVAGSASITATSNSYFSVVDITVSQTTGTSNTVFSSYASGSLSKHCSDAVDNRIVNKSAGSAINIYSTQNHASGIYVRNSGCWVNDINLTCMSPWNSTNQQNMAGTLISPRHIVFAAHYQLSNGATVRFVDSNNNTITRTMVNKRTHPAYVPYYPDITIGVLDSDVPNTISFAKILPQNWTSYLPSLSLAYRIPCLVLDAQEKALVNELENLSTYAIFRQPSNTTHPKRYEFYENIISGDSGNPAFLIINNELVILTVWTYGGPGQGTSLSYHRDAINTMMNELGGGYSLTEISLSGFNTY